MGYNTRHTGVVRRNAVQGVFAFRCDHFTQPSIGFIAFVVWAIIPVETESLQRR